MLLILALLGAVLLLDKYAVGEFGFSQPLVVCPLIGLCFGVAEVGIILGILLQLIFFSNLPIGRSIPPDSQAGAILAISSFVLLKNKAPEQNLLTFCFLIGLVGSILGTYSDVLARRLNNNLHHRFLHDEENYLRFHLLGFAVTFVRGFIFLLLFLTIVSIFSFLPKYFKIDRSILVLVSVMLGTANAFYLFIKKKHFAYLLVGVTLGCIFQFLAR